LVLNSVLETVPSNGDIFQSGNEKIYFFQINLAVIWYKNFAVGDVVQEVKKKLKEKI
jgi:hypothetical protein